MAKLVYSMFASLDGYVEDRDGSFDWAVPSEEVHAFVNDLERPLGTYLYGRRMYEAMVGWENDPTLAEQSPLMQDFAGLWQAADKVIYSTTLERVSTSRTRIERDFDPEAVRRLKSTASWATNADSTAEWSTCAITYPGDERSVSSGDVLGSVVGFAWW